jgi:hypothetical protein
MRKTEHKHWVNGYQIKGGWHKTFTFSAGRLAILLAWGRGLPQVELFWLI